MGAMGGFGRQRAGAFRMEEGRRRGPRCGFKSSDIGVESGRLGCAPDGANSSACSPTAPRLGLWRWLTQRRRVEPHAPPCRRRPGSSVTWQGLGVVSVDADPHTLASYSKTPKKLSIFSKRFGIGLFVKNAFKRDQNAKISRRPGPHLAYRCLALFASLPGTLT